MDKIYVVFWTQGGNTQAMAEAIGEGIREAGKEAEVVFVTGANLDELKAAPKFALGCPAMGAEVLEESEMEPFVCDVEGFASGKKIALFGFHMARGDSEWMRTGHPYGSSKATVLNGEGLICHETPDRDGLSECRELANSWQTQRYLKANKDNLTKRFIPRVESESFCYMYVLCFFAAT